MLRRPKRAYSITLSARATNIAGTVTPIALAVLRLITSCGREGPGLGMFVVYLGHALDSSNLCPGSLKVGLVLLIRNLLSTQWPAY